MKKQRYFYRAFSPVRAVSVAALLFCIGVPRSPNSQAAPRGPYSVPSHKSPVDMDAVAAEVAKKLGSEHLNVVAVEAFHGPNEKLPYRWGTHISDIFREAFEKRAGDIRTLRRADVVKGLETDRWLMIDENNNLVFRLVAKRLGAQAVITGKASDTGKTLKLVLTIVNLMDSKKAFEIKAEIPRPDLPEPEPEEPVRDPATGIYLSGFGVTAPRCRYCPLPEFSKEALAVHVGDTQTTLIVTVVPTGHAEDIRVLQSAGFGLDDNAVAVVKRWQFFPATLNNESVASRVEIEVRYHM
jgi:TonB family protein